MKVPRWLPIGCDVILPGVPDWLGQNPPCPQPPASLSTFQCAKSSSYLVSPLSGRVVYFVCVVLFSLLVLYTFFSFFFFFFYSQLFRMSLRSPSLPKSGYPRLALSSLPRPVAPESNLNLRFGPRPPGDLVTFSEPHSRSEGPLSPAFRMGKLSPPRAQDSAFERPSGVPHLRCEGVLWLLKIQNQSAIKKPGTARPSPRLARIPKTARSAPPRPPVRGRGLRGVTRELSARCRLRESTGGRLTGLSNSRLGRRPRGLLRPPALRG